MDELFDKKTIEKNLQKFNPTRGVYFLYDSTIKQIVYVGQSENCNVRIAQHYRDKVFDSYFIIEVDEEDDLSAVESQYIIKFNPLYNKTLPVSSRFTSRKRLSRSLGVSGIKLKKVMTENNVKPVFRDMYDIESIRRLLSA